MCGVHVPTGYNDITVPASMAQGILQKRGPKDCKSQNIGKSPVKVSSRNNCINKTGITATSVECESGRRKFHGVSPIDKELQAIKVFWVEN